jgi:hypothetical protein
VQLYPAWLKELLPHHRQVERFDQATEDHCYYLISGNGYPQLYDEIQPSIDNIRESRLYQKFVICLDVDEQSVEEFEAEVQAVIASCERPLPKTASVTIILQNRCIETWLLGNRAIFPRNPTNQQLREYITHFDVSTACPEQSPRFANFATHAAFHEDYLKKIFLERGSRVSYRKTDPGEAVRPHYLKELQDRSETTGHLPTFRRFIALCSEVRGYSADYRLASTDHVEPMA